MSEMADNPMVGGGDSIDDMLRDSSNQMHRRRSVPPPMMGQLSQDGVDHRRVSMLDFGSGANNYGNFQFGNMVSPSGNNGGFDGMGNMGINPSTFAPSSMMSMADNDFATLSPDMMGNMMAFSNLNMNNMHDPTGMGLFNGGMHSQFNSPINTVNPDFSMDLNPPNDPLGAVGADITAQLKVKSNHDMMGIDQDYGNSDDSSPTPGRAHEPRADHNFGQAQPTPSLSRQMSGTTTFATPASGTSQPVTQATAPPSVPTTQSTPAVPTPASTATPPADLRKPDLYSKTGFDMLRALWYVATRKDPKVRLGAVDMSCAFVVCDVTLNDCPIVYVSDNFQNLTGYSRHEIVGQNCRFLQAPDGKVEAGTKREFVENGAVFNLKRSIEQGKEVQQSLINYRKGGKPFLNLLTMIPIPWDTDDIRFFIGFQIDLVECPDALTGQENGGVEINYKHSDIGQYIWTPPNTNQWEPDSGQTLNTDDVSALLQATNPKAVVSDWHKQSWDKMLLENTDDVVHVLSLKGLFLYLSPSAKKILEWDASELVGNPISSICHPSDIVPVTRELKDTTAGSTVNLVFRIRRKQSGYTWFESHGSLFVEQGKGRKCIILVGRKRPVFALQRRELEANGGIGDSEIWTKLSTSGMFLFVSSNVRSLLDLLPENLQGTSIQDLMRKESRAEFGRSIEKARRGRIVTCKHEVQNKRGQVLQAMTVLYPGDAAEGSKPSFLLAQTKLIKASSRTLAPAASSNGKASSVTGAPTDVPRSPVANVPGPLTPAALNPAPAGSIPTAAQPQVGGVVLLPANAATHLGHQDAALAADDNIFDELKTTRCTSWQYELRQMEKVNRLLAEELAQLLSNKKKRKRRKGGGNMVRDCANCHTRNTPEWRRGPSGNRDLCNSCGLRWAKQVCYPLFRPLISYHGISPNPHAFVPDRSRLPT